MVQALEGRTDFAVIRIMVQEMVAQCTPKQEWDEATLGPFFP
jgi:hypothetical protein